MKARLVTVVVFFAALAASFHIYQFAIESQSLERAAKLGILTSSFFALLQLFFISCFLVCAIGLLIRKRFGLVVSFLGLVGVLLGHIAWYTYTQQNLTAIEHDPFYARHPEFIPQHPLGLIGARWWDIAVLLMSATLLIWEVNVLFSYLRSRRTESQIQKL